MKMSNVLSGKWKTIKESFHSATEKNSAAKTAYSFLHSVKRGIYRHYDDETFAQKYYFARTGKRLNLSNPVTFDEKQWWLKLYYRDPLQTVCADKYAVRAYVEECGLGTILNELFGVYSHSSEVDLDGLPDTFFLKTNHGCGSNYRCNSKKSFDWRKISRSLEKSLRGNYYYESREWPYLNVDPKIIAEKVLVPRKGELLADYRFLCFSGKCEYLFIDIDTADEYGAHKVHALRNVYDRDMTLLNVKVSRKPFDASLVPRPANYAEMLSCAEKLAGTFPFVRVDLYNLDGQIRFGEMTFFHAGGTSMISPDTFAVELGEKIILPIQKKAELQPR